MVRSLTTRQVAEQLHIERETVRKSLRTGRLLGRKEGNVWVVLEPDVLEYMARRNPKKRVSALGICSDISGFSTENFLRRKRVETQLEEEKLVRCRWDSESNRMLEDS